MKIVHFGRFKKCNSDTVEVSGAVLGNKPIRCLDTTLINFFKGILVCTAMIGDSSSVTMAERRSLKKSLEVKVAMDTLEKLRSQNI